MLKALSPLSQCFLAALYFALVLVVFFCSAAEEEERTGGPMALQEVKFRPLPLATVRPAGWLRRQLQIQASGLTGHLHEFWPDVQNSGWIGGNAEGWERAPYWLDGAVPLAYLLEDQELKEAVQRYIDYTLEHQAEDGWLGPEKSAQGGYEPRDPWPVYVMLKVLTQYYDVSGDKRVIPAMQKFFQALDRQLEERPLFSWNRMRWQDGVVSLHWLYEKTGEGWLLQLAEKMRRQGYDWLAHFQDLPHKSKVEKWEHESHVVNNAMGVKAPAVWCRQSSNEMDCRTALQALETLDRYHGQATGLFSGDECFAGKMPSQGTELCAVVEYMYSLEWLLQVLGDVAFGDRLEQITFNALPAQIRSDWWSRQYVQQANQVVAKVSEERIYTTNGPEANVFGLETNYGCCTANMHQGWPKFAAHLWMQSSDGGLAAVAYAPSRVETPLQGVETTVDLKTDYPFSSLLELEVTVQRPVRFPLRLRIPSWAEGATLQIGDAAPAPVQAGQYALLEREWSGSISLKLSLPMKVRIERRYNQAASIHRGPLVFSLRVGERWQRLRGQPPQADWEAYPTTPWNYALLLDESNPEASIRFEERPVPENPFTPEGAPLLARVQGRRLPGWDLAKNAAAPPPPSPVTSDQPLEELTLIPYGCTVLRITEFPTLAGR